MNGLENAHHDLSDASFCLETAIELLASISEEDQAKGIELTQIVSQLQQLKSGLDENSERLSLLSGPEH